MRFLLSKDQIVKAITKPLVSHRFVHLRSNLNVWSPTLRLQGRIVNVCDVCDFVNVKSFVFLTSMCNVSIYI